MIKNYASVHFYDDRGNLEEFRNYHYFTLIEDLEEGDNVVVETKNGYKVASFKSYIPYSEHARSYIIQKVDVEAIDKERELQEKREQLIKKMKVRASELKRLKEMEELAKDDETMKELVDAYKEDFKEEE